MPTPICRYWSKPGRNTTGCDSSLSCGDLNRRDATTLPKAYLVWKNPPTSLASKDVLKRVPGLRMIRVALVAAVLACSLLSSLPVSSIASGPMCELPCCAGRAPHAAGSCMHGECHVDLKSGHNSHSHQNSHSHHVKHVAPSEPLCGLSRVKTPSVVDLAKDGHHRKPDPKQPAVSSNAVSKPCVNDCGGCASATFSSSKVRSASVFSYASYARPPSSSERFNQCFNLLKQRDGLRRQFAPRPPPSFLV